MHPVTHSGTQPLAVDTSSDLSQVRGVCDAPLCDDDVAVNIHQATQHMELAVRRKKTSRHPNKMFTRILVRRISLNTAALAALLSSGCATIVEGGAQTIRIETDPPDARCTLKRSGVAVSIIPSTPATVSVFKKKGDLALTCSKPGYLNVTVDQEAEFSGTVLGNILFGGLIGAAVDMGSGATHKYPESIFLTLIPERFDNAEARDRFFAALIDRVERRHFEAIEQKHSQCTEDDCSFDVNKMNDAHEARLRFIEAKRTEAIIGSAP